MIDTNRLMQEIDIKSAIEYYTGRRFKHGKISCPFHTDKTPSLSVKNGRFMCWSCGASGSVIDFIRRLYGLSFREAVARLAIDFNLTVEGLNDEPTDKQRPDLWADLQLQIAAERAEELTRKIQELADRTGVLADQHRELYQMGDIEAADIIGEQIEEINGQIDFLCSCMRG